MSDREIRQLQKAKQRAQRNHQLKEEAELCNQLGEVLAKNGQFEAAILEHRQERGICQGLGDVIGCAVANRKMGECLAELGDYEAALKYQRLHLELAQSVSSDIEQQRALATIGRTYLYMCEGGKMEAQRPAEHAFLRSLAIVDEQLEGKVPQREISEMRARLFLNLGFLYDIMGSADQCSDFIRKSIFISEQTSLHEDLYRANLILAGVHLRAGRPSKAIRCWEAGRESARRMRDKYMESECYASIGQTLLSLGDLAAGKRALKKAHRLGSQQPSDAEIVRRNLKYAMKGCRLEESMLEVVEGDEAQALPLYEQLADLYCKVSCYSKAADCYKLQLSCAQALGRPDRELAVIHVSLATTFTDLKDYKQALLHYRAELELRKGNPEEECKTWLTMALLMEEAGLGSEAELCLEEGRGSEEVQRCLLSGLRCAQEAGVPRLQRKVLRQLLVTQEKWASPTAADTRQQLEELCDGEDSESSEEEEADNSEALQESDLEVSSSDEEEDLEGYDKSVPGKRRTLQWNRRNEKGETMLHRACIEGNLKLAKCLLEKGHPMNPRDYCGWTPLHEACNHGHRDIVELLIDGGANINDAGGALCEGITPLHDALSCGNFGVAQLLIQRGACVTQRNAKGVRPLGSLQEWLHIYGKHLDQQTRQECRDTERLLRAAMAARVSQTSKPSEDLIDPFDGEGCQPLTPRRDHADRTATRDRHSSGLLAEDDDWSPRLPSTPTTQHEDDSDNPLTPLKPVKKKARFTLHKSSAILEDSATRSEVADSAFPSIHQSRLSEEGKAAYQKAIHNLGSAKSRLLHQSLTQPDVGTEEASTKAALVPAEEYLGDDWLEDDLRTESRSRKRMRRSPPPMEEDEVVESSDGDEEDVSDGRDHPSLEGPPPLHWRDHPSLEGPPPPHWRDHPSLEGPPPPPRNPSRKRCKQTKLTQIVDRAVVGRTKSATGNDVPIPRVTDLVQPASMPIHSQQAFLSSTPQPAAMSAAPSLPPPIRVRVRVEDNVFLIPIPHSDSETREISWLAEQASQRYYQSCGLRPRLTLKKEGALLDPRDLILYVLQSNEEVLAEVHSWDLPPLMDRYRKSCQSLGIKESGPIVKALEQQEVSACLSLCRLALKPHDVSPLLRALKLQSSLRHLQLSGNLLGDNQMDELQAMLATIPHLTNLNLSCNRLTHQGIGRLVPADGRRFEKLEELDLGMNPLGDGLAQPLAFLLNHCPLLTTINLQACQLSAKFLQQYRLLLADAFRGAVHMKRVSLSHNPLGSVGVELILKTLPHDTISRLDLQAVASGDGPMMDSVVRYLSQDGCVLSHLILSCNNLTDESIQDFARCLPLSSLKVIDLSGNPKVGVEGFESLLSAIQERSAEVDELHLTGCAIQGPIAGSLLDKVSSRLQDLRLGSQLLSQKEQQMVVEAWGSQALIVCRHNKLFCRKVK